MRNIFRLAALLGVVLSAQTTDLYKFPPGQENSQEFKAVVAWIKSFDGGPECSQVVRLKSDPFDSAGRTFVTAQAICVKPAFADLQVDAALLLRHPAVSLVELKHAFNFGDPAKYENFRYVVEPLQPKPPGATPLPPQPDNPVGPEFAPGKFFIVPGDIKPSGFIFTDAERVFRKACRNQLGSAQSCWYDELK